MRKAICLFLVFAMMLSMAACQAPEDDIAEAPVEAVTEAPAETAAEMATEAATEQMPRLSISGLNYPESGSIDDFRIDGTIMAEAGLEGIVCEGQMSDGNFAISTDAAAYSFGEGTTTAKLSSLNNFLAEQMEMLCNFFSMLGGNSGEATLDCICYDAAGNTVRFTIIYQILSE